MTLERRPDPPPGQKACSAEHYAKLSPQGKGYMSYMQAAWNPDVPEESPYEPGSREDTLFKLGQQQAVLDVQDGEE